MGGYVMQIQNFSVNDGEGIRTNVFLSGCPLRCRWCSNPEGQTLQNAMTHYMTTEEVVDAIKKQMIFYRKSDGGVTFSGGEATMQEEFLRELAEMFYDMGISLAIETCGAFEFEKVEDILKKMDLIFYDIKHMDGEKHQEYTGVTNEIILHNLSKVAKLHVPMVVRIPVIHGANTDEENLRKTFAFIRDEAPEARLELLPYHTFGEDKYRALDIPCPPDSYSTPTEEEIGRWNQMAEEMGISVVSYR